MGFLIFATLTSDYFSGNVQFFFSRFRAFGDYLGFLPDYFCIYS